MQIDARSERNLSRVHPDLVKVMRKAFAINKGPQFVITEGARTVERQRQLVAAKASRTMNSRHIPGKDGYAKAVDIAFVIDGKARWDWPLFRNAADTIKSAAKAVGVPITWGGDWRTFKDGPHFELPRDKYP